MNEERQEAVDPGLPAVPPDARVVALVGSAGDPHAARSAAQLAAMLGGSRDHVLLASLEGPRGALDEFMGVTGGSGFGSLLRGEAKIPEIAVQGEGGAFVYLPQGDAPASAMELLRVPRLRALAERLRSSGGTLLLYLPAEGILDEDVDFVDAVVTLEPREAEVPVTEEAVEDPFDEPEPTARQPQAAHEATTAQLREAAQKQVAEESPATWRRHQPRRRFPVRKVVLGVLIVVALPVGWWALSQSLLSRASSARPDATGASGEGAPTLVQPPGQSTSREDWDEAIAASPELPYSVLLASYASWQDAIERRDELQTAGSRLYFIAPTPLGGALYYRVFAGATATADSATVLMEELVRLGRKETVSEWDIRPVGLAFALGVYPSRVEAEAFEDRLEQQRIPAYTVPVTADGDSAFQVYAGGFESASAAEALAAQLEDAGWQTELLPRRGVER